MFVFTTSGCTMRAEIKWIIHNYDLKWPKTTNTLDSPLFYAERDEGVKWGIKISPQGPRQNSSSWNLGYASFYVHLEESSVNEAAIVAKFSIIIFVKFLLEKSICCWFQQSLWLWKLVMYFQNLEGLSFSCCDKRVHSTNPQECVGLSLLLVVYY